MLVVTVAVLYVFPGANSVDVSAVPPARSESVSPAPESKPLRRSGRELIAAHDFDADAAADPDARLAARKVAHRSFVTSDYLRMSARQILRYLDTSDKAQRLGDVESFCADVRAVRDELRTKYESIHAAWKEDCGRIARSLYRRGGGRRPAADAPGRAVAVYVNSQKVFLAETEYPHLFVFKDEVADMPRELARRILAAARNY